MLFLSINGLIEEIISFLLLLYFVMLFLFYYLFVVYIDLWIVY